MEVDDHHSKPQFQKQKFSEYFLKDVQYQDGALIRAIVVERVWF